MWAHHPKTLVLWEIGQIFTCHCNHALGKVMGRIRPLPKSPEDLAMNVVASLSSLPPSPDNYFVEAKAKNSRCVSPSGTLAVPHGSGSSIQKSSARSNPYFIS